MAYGDSVTFTPDDDRGVSVRGTKATMDYVDQEEYAMYGGEEVEDEVYYSPLASYITNRYDKNTQKYFEYGYNINPDVYSIVNQIANKFTSIPYVIQEIKDKDSYQKYDPDDKEKPL